MPIATIEEAVEEIRQGKMVILVDDEDRENEGDLTMAAEMVTPEAINFMARFGRGLICLTLTPEKCDTLRLPPMVQPIPHLSERPLLFRLKRKKVLRPAFPLLTGRTRS